MNRLWTTSGSTPNSAPEKHSATCKRVNSLTMMNRDHLASSQRQPNLSTETMQSIHHSFSKLALESKQPKQFDSAMPALHSTVLRSTISDSRSEHIEPMNGHQLASSLAGSGCASSDQCQTKPFPNSKLESKQLKPIDVALLIPESERSLSWAAMVAINEALFKHDRKVDINEFCNSAEYKAMCQLKDPPRPKSNNNNVMKLPRSTQKYTPPTKKDPRQLESDRRRIYDEM